MRKVKTLFVFAVLVGFLWLTLSCGGSGNVNIQPVDPPTISLSANSLTVKVGDSGTLTATTTGTYPISVTCSVSGPGTCSVSGNAVTYKAPASTPPSWSATLVASAQNSAGTAEAKATVSLVQAPTVTLSRTSATVLVGQSASVSFSLTGNPTPAVTCSVSGAGTCGVSGSTLVYTGVTPTATENWNPTVTVTASNSVGQAPPVTLTVTLEAPPAIVSVSPASATVPLGVSGVVIVSVSGNPEPAVSCSATIVSVQATSTGCDYTAPIAVPSSWSDKLIVTATNSVSSVSTTVPVALQYPVPHIDSVTPPSAYCETEYAGCNPQFTISGSGFYAGGVLHAQPLWKDMTLAPGTSPTRIVVNMWFGSPQYSPGAFNFTVSSPPGGPGGGTSNVAYFAFLGSQPSLAASATDAFENIYTGGTLKFKLADGSSDGTLPFGGFGIAVDNQTSYIVLSDVVGLAFGYMYSDGSFTWLEETTHSQITLGVSALSGYACASMPYSSQLGAVDMAQAMHPGLNGSTTLYTPPLVTTTFNAAAGDHPLSVATFLLGGNLYCATYDVANRNLYVVSVALPDGSGNLQTDMTLRGSTVLTDFTPSSGLPPAQGGWQLVALGSGTNAVTLGLLSEYDKELVPVSVSLQPNNPFVSVAAESAVALSGIPMRLAADGVHGTFIVVNADDSTGGSTFSSVNPSTSAVAPLTATTPFMVSGCLTSPDGASLYCAGRSQFIILQNQ